jgi:hypothetical protein
MDDFHRGLVETLAVPAEIRAERDQLEAQHAQGLLTILELDDEQATADARRAIVIAGRRELLRARCESTAQQLAALRQRYPRA